MSAVAPVVVSEFPGLEATLSSGRKGQSPIRVPQARLGDDAGSLTVNVATLTTPDGGADQVARTLRVKRG